MANELNKSGYQYLKEKNERLEKEVERLNLEIAEYQDDIVKWEEKYQDLEDEHEKEIFERLIKKIRVMRDWEES